MSLQVVSDSLQLPHPFALTMFGDALYLTDWNTHAIYTCNRSTGADCRTLVTNLFSPMDIHVYHPSRQPAGNDDIIMRFIITRYCRQGKLLRMYVAL